MFSCLPHSSSRAVLRRRARTTVDDGGEYGNVTVDEVHRYEPNIPIAAGGAQAYLSTTTHRGAEYSLTVRAANGDELIIARDATGAVTRECVSAVTKVGCSGRERRSW